MLHTAGTAAVDELQVRGHRPHRPDDRGSPLGQLPPGGGLHQPDRPRAQGPPGDRVPDSGDVSLVRHDPHQPEARPPGHGPRQLGELGGGVQRRTPGPDPDPAAEQLQRGVQLQADPDHFTPAVPRRVDQIEVRRVVDHHGDGTGQLGIGGQLGEARPVRRRIGQQDVLEPRTREPQRLVQGERHDALEAVLGQDAFQQGPAANRLAGDPHGLPSGTADQVVRVGVEGVQVHDRERGVEMGGGPVVTGPVGGARSHDGSLPDRITAG